MTLQPYDADRIDQLSLRVFDLCARLRATAHICREAALPAVDLHDRKALEWIEKLEEWMFRARLTSLGQFGSFKALAPPAKSEQIDRPRLKREQAEVILRRIFRAR